MNRTIGAIAIWTIAVAFTVGGASVSAQTLQQPVYIGVTRQAGSIWSYRLNASAFGFTLGVSLTAPDGTVFESTPTRRLYEVDNLTASELTSRFAGKWTVNDAWDLPPGAATQLHSFNITTAQLSTFPATPGISSPAPNAIVPAVFNVVSGGNGLRITGGPVEFLTFNGSIKPLKVLFTPGEQQREIGIRATSQNYMQLGNIPAPTTNPTHRFRLVLTQNSESAPRYVTAVVPEPMSLTLASAGMLALATLRRR
ncbi:hypothetical protein [Lacipirellula sp.]|uniref:hypothetical protein n=1 Tax=Lacipirellula sp. TaxID=2691419 RepID=UPI003D0E4B05